MTGNDHVRKSISDTVDDIARIQREMGCQIVDPDDWEARQIIERIERRLKSQAPVPQAPEDAL